jgi:NitT/TauT family transport system substrate-binding protein
MSTSFFSLSRTLQRGIASACVTLASVAALGFSAPAVAEVKIGVSDWPGWVAWYVAEQKGYFKKHGADVKLVWFANYTDSISALSAGQLDANSQTWSRHPGAALSKGLPLKAVLVNDNSAGNDALLVSPKIKSFAQLKGKRSRAGTVQRVPLPVLTTALAKNNLTLKRREDRQPLRRRCRRRLHQRQGGCRRVVEPVGQPD